MEGSPVWKRPSEVMKIHRRRKSLSQKKVTASEEKRTDFIYKSPSKAVKRRNPFTSSDSTANKRQNINNSNAFRSNDSCALFSILDSAEPSSQKDKHENSEVSGLAADFPDHTEPQVSQVKQNICETINHQEIQQSEAIRHGEQSRLLNSQPETVISPHLPVDWCLKTKLRVVSSRPLTWCTQLKSVEEASGVTNFIHNEMSTSDTLAEQKMEFQKSLMYWIHPNLPWVKLFPRIVDDSRSGKSLSLLLQDDVQASLQAAWEESFTSAFHLLRSRLCPYFYLCTHQFTVLFCGGIRSQSDMLAMVTPTTRGFREQLQKEGITFSLPVGNKQSSPGSKGLDRSGKEETETQADADNSPEPVPPNRDPVDDDEEEDDCFETDEGASGWLESIGLDKKEFPTLDPRKVKLQREGFRVIDHRPESLVCVEGSEVQGLFNFLLNCRTCTATSGTQAGVPPTILSPKGFKGATLKCQKVKHTVVKQPDKEGAITHAHIVEITGPILPHHTESLISLYHRTQQRDFGVVFNNHDITATFNVLGRLKAEKDDQNMDDSKENLVTQNSDSGKTEQDNTSAQHFRHKPISDRVCAVKEIISTPEGFMWNT